jgi:hypothetical protein
MLDVGALIRPRRDKVKEKLGPTRVPLDPRIFGFVGSVEFAHGPQPSYFDLKNPRRGL